MVVINITDKLSMDKPKIRVGDKEYEVNNDMETVLKFEELASTSKGESMMKAVELAIGSKAAKGLGMSKMPVPNFKVLTVAILACMQGITYDEAEARFLSEM